MNSIMSSDQQGPSEDQAGQGQSDNHYSILDECALVPYDHNHLDRRAYTAPEEPSLASSRGQSTYSREESDVVALSMERQQQ
jgi:hypothetical protein